MSQVKSQVETVDLITQFRMMVYEHFPYLAPYVYSLTPVERPGLGTMAVDKYGRMYYDPDWCETLTLEQGGYVVVHEALHLILRHCHRAPGIYGDHPTPQEARDLNIAMDVVVWEFMEAIAKMAPEGGVTFDNVKAKWPAVERNMTIEQLYHIISESRNPPPPPPPGGKEKDEDGDQEIEDENGGGKQESPPEDKEGDGKGRSKVGDDVPQDGGSGGGDEVADDGFKPIGGGSASDGQPRDYEEEPDGNWDGFKEDRLLEAVEQKMEELEEDSEWRHHINGTLAAGLKRLIKNKLRPQPNPWDQLRATVCRCAANHKGAPDYTYQRKNRRQYATPDMPLLKGVKKYMPKAVVVVDTSGSMTAGCLRKAIQVIRDGLKAIGEVPVITCDAQIGQDIKVRSIPEDFEFVGGGGTDMRVPLAHSEKEYAPDVTILVTDTYTPWPDQPLKGQLIVAATQDGSVPSWATKVLIPNDPNKESLDDE
jgi:predicted metal-dependent peptidase